MTTPHPVALIAALALATPALAQPAADAEPAYAPGLVLHVYDIGTEIGTLRDLTPDQRPNVAHLVSSIDLTDDDFGLSDHFRTVLTGHLRVPTTGTYSLRLTSDDGSRLTLAGVVVLDHDGQHGMEAKTIDVDLPEGVHPIRIDHFDDTYNAGLRLEWKAPGDTHFTLIPRDALLHAGTPDTRTAQGQKTLVADPTANPEPDDAPAQREYYGDPPDDWHDWAVHDPDRPLPPVVDPPTPSTPARAGSAPSDAVVLFDGNNPDADLAAWEKPNGDPPGWAVRDGYFEIVPGSGGIRTKESFGDVQLHIEWLVPDDQGHRTGQNRGNSGVFLMSQYEVQVLETRDNDTYADGMAAAIYAENPPLVNAGTGMGNWQTYDIIFRRPIFADDGTVLRPARTTVLHNGVLVQDGWAHEGHATHRNRSTYRPHPDALPLMLQNHSEPTRFRNVWVRPLPERPVSPTEQQMHHVDDQGRALRDE